MRSLTLPASFTDVQLPKFKDHEQTWLVVPMMAWNELTQVYHFMDLGNGRAVRVKVELMKSRAPVAEFLRSLVRANPWNEWFPFRLRLLRHRYPFEYHLKQWIYASWIPHTCIRIAPRVFLFGLLINNNRFVRIDLDRQTAEAIDPEIGDDCVNTTLWSESSGDLWFASFSMHDTYRRADVDIDLPVGTALWKLAPSTGKVERVWEGSFRDAVHDLVLTPDKRFAVACEFGMHRRGGDGNGGLPGELIPSAALVVDFKTGRSHTIDGILTGAHAQVDPDDPRTIYLTTHNASSADRRAAFFYGPASTLRFRLEDEGPVKTGEATDPDFLRGTDQAIFRHRGRKLIERNGHPDIIFLFDAETMQVVKKISHNGGPTTTGIHRFPVEVPSFPDAYMAVPSPDGEKLFIAAAETFKIIDIESGCCDWMWSYPERYYCANHLGVAAEESWPAPAKA